MTLSVLLVSMRYTADNFTQLRGCAQLRMSCFVLQLVVRLVRGPHTSHSVRTRVYNSAHDRKALQGSWSVSNAPSHDVSYGHEQDQLALLYRTDIVLVIFRVFKFPADLQISQECKSVSSGIITKVILLIFSCVHILPDHSSCHARHV
jgi:hypothetical protein